MRHILRLVFLNSKHFKATVSKPWAQVLLHDWTWWEDPKNNCHRARMRWTATRIRSRHACRELRHTRVPGRLLWSAAPHPRFLILQRGLRNNFFASEMRPNGRTVFREFVTRMDTKKSGNKRLHIEDRRNVREIWESHSEVTVSEQRDISCMAWMEWSWPRITGNEVRDDKNAATRTSGHSSGVVVF